MTYTKTVAAIGIASSLLIGCSSSNSPTAAGKPAGYSEDGGVNGGGGGTLPAQPIGTYRVRQIIQEAKQDLIPFLNFELWSTSYRKAVSSVETKLFYGKPNLLDVLHETDIEVKYAEPCYDANGREVDGSVHASKPNAICISAFRIAPKLEEEKARTEILALLLHELSHKLGATEDEATEYQRQAAFMLALRDGRNQTGEEFVRKAVSASMDFSSFIHELEKVSKSQDVATLKAGVEKFIVAESKFMNETHQIPFALFSGEERAFEDIQMARIYVASWYLNSASEPYAKDRLEKAFEGAESITFAQFQTRLYPHTDISRHPYVNERISRPHSLQQAAVVVAEVLPFYREAFEIALSLQIGARPNPLPLPNNKDDHFEQFLGTYESIAAVCSDGEAPYYTGFRIEKSSDQKTVLFRTKSSGYGYGGELHTGGSGSNQGSAMFVTGGNGWAKRDLERMNRWGSRQHTFSTVSLTMRATTNAFQVIEVETLRREIFDWENPSRNGFEDTTNTCTYELKKTN